MHCEWSSFDVFQKQLVNIKNKKNEKNSPVENVVKNKNRKDALNARVKKLSKGLKKGPKKGPVNKIVYKIEARCDPEERELNQSFGGRGF